MAGCNLSDHLYCFPVAITPVAPHYEGAPLNPRQHLQNRFNKAFEVVGLAEMFAAFAKARGARFLVLKWLAELDPLNCGIGGCGHRGSLADHNLELGALRLGYCVGNSC